MTRFSLCAALLPLAVAGCNSASAEMPLKPEGAAISVQTAEVKARPMPNELLLTGQLVANQQSDVAANAVGRVVKTLVDRGSVVRSGEILAQLDTKSAQLSEAEARANLENAQASEELAQELCKRNTELLQRGAISKEEGERTASQCRTSAASLEAARARSAMAEKTLSDATVRAPFSGMIGERYVSVGEYVQPATRVVTLVQLDPLRLQLTVSEADIGKIHEDQQVSFSVEAFPDRTFTGTLKFVDPTVRTSTRDLIAEAVVANADHALRAGMFATAHLTLPDQMLPAVQQDALVIEGSSTRLFAIVAGHVEERVVQKGPSRDGWVALLDGAKDGDKVVSPVTSAVKDGVPVK